MANRKKEGREYWRRVFGEWSSSGLSQRRFCKERGISYSTFCYWRRRMTESETTESESSPFFVPVKIKPATEQPTPSYYEIRLENGVGIRVSFDFESESLARLIELLRGE
ncbi:MAG: hypothetical protein KC978_22650 [Candidatus Omnitrophica bacterium]|nr:hypothetical protein [Candidatus Omnitrophota bacterium]